MMVTLSFWNAVYYCMESEWSREKGKIHHGIRRPKRRLRNPDSSHTTETRVVHSMSQILRRVCLSNSSTLCSRSRVSYHRPHRRGYDGKRHRKAPVDMRGLGSPGYYALCWKLSVLSLHTPVESHATKQPHGSTSPYPTRSEYLA
jgi:hypothetical protein